MQELPWRGMWGGQGRISSVLRVSGQFGHPSTADGPHHGGDHQLQTVAVRVYQDRDQGVMLPDMFSCCISVFCQL